MPADLALHVEDNQFLDCDLVRDDAAQEVVYAAGAGIAVWFVLALVFDSIDWTQRART